MKAAVGDPRLLPELEGVAPSLIADTSTDDARCRGAV